MRRATSAALAALLAWTLAGGAAAQQTGATTQAQQAQAQDAPRAEDAEAQQAQEADAPEAENAEGQAQDPDSQDGEGAQAQDSEAQQAGEAGAQEAQEPGPQEPDPQALAECLVANAGEEEEAAFRDFLTFALTEEPQDVLRQSASAFSGGMIAIGATKCDMALADFQTEAGRQAAAAYTQHLAQQVMEAAFARLAR